MELIARYQNAGFEAIADGVIDFFERRSDLHRKGLAFDDESISGFGEPAKVSTDISLVAIDHSDPEAFAIADVILRGVTAALSKYLEERSMFKDCSPGRALFVTPIFNIQRYAPGEGFKRWHCDWTISHDATEPVHRALAWIMYCNDIDEAGTEFFWQDFHETAERGKLIIFPAGLSHIHRGRVNKLETKTIVSGWINAGNRDSYMARLAK